MYSDSGRQPAPVANVEMTRDTGTLATNVLPGLSLTLVNAKSLATLLSDDHDDIGESW